MTIAVFAKGDKAREAEEAGADFVGAEDLAERVQNEGFTDFDVAIATPDMMPVVGRLGRILGPQGKMPNPKVGTVTMDVAQGRRGVQGRQGRVPHRPHRDRPHDRSARPRFDDEQLLENYQAVIEELIRAKPSAAKGKYLRTIVMASTHGAGHQGRPVAHARPDRGGGGGSCRARKSPASSLRFPPKTPGRTRVSPGQEEAV